MPTAHCFFLEVRLSLQNMVTPYFPGTPSDGFEYIENNF